MLKADPDARPDALEGGAGGCLGAAVRGASVEGEAGVEAADAAARQQTGKVETFM